MARRVGQLGGRGQPGHSAICHAGTGLCEHAELLRKHAAAIRLYEQDFTAHEHALAEYERGESGEELVQLAEIHGLHRGKACRISVENTNGQASAP